MCGDEPKPPDGSQTIVAYIDGRGRSGSGESLMKFVERRREDDKHDGSQLGLRQIGLLVFQATIGQKRENEILRDVAELSNDAMPEIEFLRRKVREEKCQDRDNDLRGLSSGKSIRGENENEDQPKDEGRPVFDNEILH
jgi:hypothetical protein